ncbi:mucin-2-like [Cotesia glomerata]|uniref:mucin-2-like n=1 Tax=Cotesia glomerata TaxID=32391 RepID=UPI001D014EC1|nr:mucin-2-like [Cotesia glomerata]
MGSEMSPTPVRVSIRLTSLKTPPPVSSPGLGPPLATPRPPSPVPGPSWRPDTPVQPITEIGGSGNIPGHVPDVSKGAIPRRPPATYVKTRVFTRSQPPATKPRRSSVLPVTAPARTTPAATAESTPMEVEKAAALPTKSQHAANTQVASTSTFKLPECPPHLTPAFAAYKEALERAAKTGVQETGIPRAEEIPEPVPTNVPVRRRTKKKKKRKKGELRGPNWAAMEYFGGSAPPVSEDSGIGDGEDSDDDVLELDYDGDL